ncbi:TonB-dependent receptor [Dysgonomonas sp. 511]|uniref:TonB-dependent receptor n=1 Tax=Dysgonomonas sp. 511 TaxID=2302930 RepID=UPI0013D38193|nr:TonB-dependent receptor [Dysgonomonas sp. 511]NDV79218.1 TonB-dependent siderophore receptor [Dysgonomonas sp. 511]
MRKICATLILLAISIQLAVAGSVKGRVVDQNGNSLPSATVTIKELGKVKLTDDNGVFYFKNLPERVLTIEATFIGYQADKQQIDLSLQDSVPVRLLLNENNQLEAVEVFGERYKQPEKLDAITRMPLRPSEQIQSISVISDKVIAEQGALTITDAVRNVPGVTLFGSYGGVRESLSTRGYRGVPILKNGVRVDSDFRTASLASDMQGVESVQVIKGSAAITQGVGNDLGSPGGIINVVTKTPKFVNGGEVSFRTGSWGQVRPTFDVQSVLDRNRTIAFRLNGAYERMDNYRPIVSMDKVYINPSVEWRPDNMTTVTVEMDYLNNNSTPYTSTVNLAGDDTEALYDMPHSKFLGFATDNNNTKTLTYAARLTRQLSNVISVRAAYFAASNTTDNTSASLSSIKGQDLNKRARGISRSHKEDKNSTFQLDLIGRDVYTGTLKHTFQLGFDYKMADVASTSYGAWNGSISKLGAIAVDTIDVLADKIANPEIESVTWPGQSITNTQTSTYGIMAQEVLTINKYLKAILGLRYSSISVEDETIKKYQKTDKIVDGNGKTQTIVSDKTAISSSPKTTESAWNPMAGLMISPLENVNLFGSYTTTTNLRSAANLMSNGERIGASVSKQWEFGVKSDWLNNRLRFNFTYFHIINKNLSNTEYVEGTNQPTGYHIKAGDLKRRGIETELSGRILENLQVMLGYAYLDAEYQNSPSYVSGSAPMNAPMHTANGWIQYKLDKSVLKGLSIGVGVYYVGDRPVNEYSLSPDGHGSPTGTKPFDMPAYTTINAQLGYTYNKVTARVFFNNIFDEIGYNSYYRGGFINQIDPRNFAAVVSYRF